MTREQRVEVARQTPAGLAWVLSEGRWHCAKHLEVLNHKLLDLAAGRITRLAVFMPPRFGKSTLVSRYFPAWFLGTFPDSRVIQAGYGASFAASWGRHARNAIDDACKQGIFDVRVDPAKSSADEWDIEGREGGMFCCGIGSGVTGRGADLLTIDDPVKSRAEAESITYRERAWSWYTDDAYTRLHPGGRVLLTATRWHHDDMPGRILARDSGRDEWEVVCFPAFAEEEGDALGRALGEPLWPERFGTEFLDNRRLTLGDYGFSALYQQHPSPREGGLFKRDWFTMGIVDEVPLTIKRRVRYWDLAGTAGGGDWTVGVRVGVTADNEVYIEHVCRGQWGPHEVKQRVAETAETDGKATTILVEQEPGSSGKLAIDDLNRSLPGFAVRADRVTGDKELRAMPFAAACEARRVHLVRNGWDMQAFIDELTTFPGGTHDDQVDAASGAYTGAVASKRQPFIRTAATKQNEQAAILAAAEQKEHDALSVVEEN